MPVTKLSQVLRKFRRSQEITLIDMTTAIGYPPSEFSAVVSGARGPKSLRLLVGRIVAYFDLTDEEKAEIRKAAQQTMDTRQPVCTEKTVLIAPFVSVSIPHETQPSLAKEAPCFILNGRDPFAPIILKMWTMMYRHYIRAGLLPDTSEADARISEAFRIATEMEIFGREQQTQQEMALTELNSEGYAIARNGIVIDRGKKGA